MKKLRLILGDQLNAAHSWFNKKDDQVLYVMMEIRQETDYVRHHVQKIIGFFLAMRGFAVALENAGHRVRYIKIGDNDNRQSLIENLRALIKDEGIEQFEYQLPDEYRLDIMLREFSPGIPVSASDTEHFLTTRNELATLFKGKKSYLMETFYREMRMKHNIMVDKQMKPEGGKWNYDAENRKKWKGDPAIPDFPSITHRVSDLLQEIKDAGVETFGEVNTENFSWPISRSESRKILDHFAAELLPHFGSFQDAMHTEQRFLFHSRLSFSMNSKMLDPLEVVNRVITEWRKRPAEIDIAQVEGFVRQIIGWREYMRGVYWAHMPDYAELNFFEHDLPLPDFYWTGETKMNCLKHSIRQSLEEAYAHHIQRLMITGNFALLLGVHPDAVDAWYLGIYIDALEWVEITNTRGMSQFADGGIVGTKPYISAANYVNKMSNYCSGCSYNRSKRVGDDACPFNALYWNFLDRHREKLAKNHRMSMMFRLVDKMAPEERQAIASRAAEIRKNPDAY